MSKVLKTIAIVAAVVAVAATGLGAIMGAAAFAAAFGASAATIASVAAVVSTAASLGAAALQKPPDVKGTINEVVIGANLPLPCGIGRTYIGGMKVYDDSANGTGGAPNKDRTQIMVGSIGPIDSFENFYGDYNIIPFSGGTWNSSRVATGYYGADGGYMWLNTRLGLLGETALSAFPGRSAFTGWGTSHKLSGLAAWSVTMEFDEDGERYASGIPAFGMVAKWAKVYDPRLDSTYPGGSGTQRWADESTWAWSENPALHALTYARGRFQNSKKVFGVGLSQAAINVPVFVELANTAEANAWTCGGAIYEGPGLSKWDNLKRILQAAAAEPAWVKGQLTIKTSSPKTALTTITADQLADGDIEIQAMSNWKDRVNTAVFRYRSEPHKWDYVQADAIENTTYITEDGESKTVEMQFDLVQDVNQGAQLAAYYLVNKREFPITLTAKNHLRHLAPGEAVAVDIPEVGLSNQLCVIQSRSIDPSTGSVQFVMMSETTAKHSYALGKTGTAPPTPTIHTGQDLDVAVSDGTSPAPVGANLIPSPVRLNRATFTNGASLEVIAGATGRIADHYRALLVFGANSTAYWCETDAIPCVPGETLYYQHAVKSDVSTVDACNASVAFYGADGSFVTATNLGTLGGMTPNTTCTGTEAIGSWVTKKAQFVVPANVSFVRPYVERPNWSGTGTFLVGEPYLGRAEPGSDQSYWIDGVADWTFQYDSLGSPLAGEFNKDFTYSLKTKAGLISSGVAWTYTVIEGTVNGKTNANGAQAMSGTGVGTFTASSLGSSTATVKISASYGGYTRATFVLKLAQFLNPAASGGTTTGSGGTMPISKSSGWATIASGSFADLSGPMSGTMPSGKTTANAGGSLFMRPASGAVGTWNMEAKLQRNTGTSGSPIWTDVGSVVTGTTTVSTDPESGATLRNGATLTFNINDTGRTAGSSYDWRIVGRINGTGSTDTTRSHAVTGTITISAP